MTDGLKSATAFFKYGFCLSVVNSSFKREERREENRQAITCFILVCSKYLFILCNCWNGSWILAMKTSIQSLKKSAVVLFVDLAKLSIKTS